MFRAANHPQPRIPHPPQRPMQIRLHRKRHRFNSTARHVVDRPAHRRCTILPHHHPANPKERRQPKDRPHVLRVLQRIQRQPQPPTRSTPRHQLLHRNRRTLHHRRGRPALPTSIAGPLLQPPNRHTSRLRSGLCRLPRRTTTAGWKLQRPHVARPSIQRRQHTVRIPQLQHPALTLVTITRSQFRRYQRTNPRAPQAPLRHRVGAHLRTPRRAF